MTPILIKIMQNTLKIREIRGYKCSTSVESIRQIDLFLQNKANFYGRSQKTEVRMQKKINMYKSLFNKEIQTLSIGRFPLMTLSKLSRIGSKTKPKQTQSGVVFDYAGTGPKND